MRFFQLRYVRELETCCKTANASRSHKVTIRICPATQCCWVWNKGQHRNCSFMWSFLIVLNIIRFHNKDEYYFNATVKSSCDAAAGICKHNARQAREEKNRAPFEFYQFCIRKLSIPHIIIKE